MGKDPRNNQDPKNTINDDDWQNLQNRANKANPDAWKLTDEEGAQRRKIANANYENRNQN